MQTQTSSVSRTLALRFPSVCLGIALMLTSHIVAAESRPAPEFPSRSAGEWINSPPIRLAGLRGQVVLIDFWAFEYRNSYRSLPWLNRVETRFRDQGLAVVGVHSPKFAHEKVISSIRQKVDEFGITYPVMVDSDHAYWRALGNHHWPAFYLIDRKGNLRDLFVGETHAGDFQAIDIEERIASLLAEH